MNKLLRDKCLSSNRKFNILSKEEVKKELDKIPINKPTKCVGIIEDEFYSTITPVCKVVYAHLNGDFIVDQFHDDFDRPGVRLQSDKCGRYVDILFETPTDKFIFMNELQSSKPIKYEDRINDNGKIYIPDDVLHNTKSKLKDITIKNKFKFALGILAGFSVFKLYKNKKKDLGRLL